MRIASPRKPRSLAIDKNSRSLTLASLLTLIFLLTLIASVAAQAQTLLPNPAAALENAPQSPQIWDLPTQGPPTTNVLLQGAGFDPLTAIDVYFDTTILTSTTTDKNGGFGNGVVTDRGASFTRLQVPAAATPGQHTITAQERVGQKSAQLSFLVQTDWPQFHYDAAHSGLNPYENVLGPDNVSNLTVRWTSSDTGASSPVVAGGIVYYSSNSYLHAVDAATGTSLWTYPTGDDGSSSPAVANGVVYVGSTGLEDYTPGLYAVNAKTGALVWYNDQYYGIYLTVDSGVIYTAAASYVFALDANTGAELWTYMVPSRIQSAPAVANGMVYVGAHQTNFYALDAKTGNLVWKYPTGFYVYSSSAVANGLVYIGLDQLYAFNASTGAVVWKYPISYAYSPGVANGVVYVGSSDGNVYALTAATGTLLWKTATGSIFFSSVAIANGVVYVGSNNGNLNALDAAKGTLLWTYNTGSNSFASSPAVVNGMVYVGGADAVNMYAFGLPNQQDSANPGRQEAPVRK